MTEYKVLITDNMHQKGLEILQNDEEIDLDIKEGITSEELKRVIDNYDGLIIRSGTKIPKNIVSECKKLKTIIRGGVGVDGVDIEECTKRGIVIMNTPTGNTIAATEHTMALLLSALRDIDQANASVKKGEWKRKQFMGQELYKKTIGIIGLGRIGSRVASRCKAFEMKVLAYDPYIPISKADTIGATLVNKLEELLINSDIISIHTPLTEETKNMIGKKEFEKMKKGVIIINCARGGILNEEDLYHAIEEGIVSKAGIDVYSEEPPSKNMKLIGMNNVITTPHIGANTYESQQNIAVMSANQMISALKHGIYINAVNLPFSFNEEEARTYYPYMELTRKAALVLAQLHKERIQEVKVEYKGKNFQNLTPLLTAALKGIFSHILGNDISYLNAQIMAQEREIKIEGTRTTSGMNYENLIKITLNGKYSISATMFDNKHAKIVQIDGFRLELTPAETILIITNNDKPGVVAGVATVLGNNEINIAEWHLGREGKGGMAISAVTIDEKAEEKVIEEIMKVTNVITVQQVEIK